MENRRNDERKKHKTLKDVIKIEDWKYIRGNKLKMNDTTDEIESESMPITPYCSKLNKSLNKLNNLSKKLYRQWNQAKTETHNSFSEAINNSKDKWNLFKKLIQNNCFTNVALQNILNLNPINKEGKLNCVSLKKPVLKTKEIKIKISIDCDNIDIISSTEDDSELILFDAFDQSTHEAETEYLQTTVNTKNKNDSNCFQHTSNLTLSNSISGFNLFSTTHSDFKLTPSVNHPISKKEIRDKERRKRGIQQYLGKFDKEIGQKVKDMVKRKRKSFL